MNGLDFLLDGSVWQQQAIRLSLTLLHFVWQGVLVGVVAAIALACFNRKSANTRYLIACVAFFGLPLLAAATFWLVEVPVDVAIVSPGAIENGDPILAESLPIADSSVQPLLVDASPTSKAVLPSESAAAPRLENKPAVRVLPEAIVSQTAGLAAIYPLLPWVAAAYLTGALALLLRLQLRIWRGSRLCSRSPAVQDPSLLDLAARLAKQAGLKCVPAIRYCDRVVVPTVVGILKPVVLVPASLISQLTQEELTAILNHELAHIRRWDPVVQVLQKTVEALLFFHPITWWLSRRIRVERENCCDDIASRDSGQLSYAAALLRMAELCLGNDQKRLTALADLAVDGNNKTEFASRIRRLIGADDTPSFGLSRRGVYMLLAVGMLASVSFAASTSSHSISDKFPTPGDYQSEIDTGGMPMFLRDPKLPESELSNIAAPANESRVSDNADDTDDNILWSKKNRNGLVAGAKLLSATGKLKLGDPVVVQFVLKNDSDKDQTFVLRASDSHPTLGENNRLELNVIGNAQNTFQHTLKPGEILVKREYRVSVDTNGMPPGKYHITSSSAFWQAKKDNPGSASGIPFGRKIPFTVGNFNWVQPKQALKLPPADENPETKIYWGKPSGNLILGMRLSKGRQTWPDDQTDIQGQLFLFNAGDDDVELTCQLPANVADWNMHVTSREHNNHVKLDSTWFTGIEPLRTRSVRIPSGEQAAITGVRADVTTGKATAAEVIKGPTLRILKEKTKFEYGDPKRLINQQGRFNFHASLTINRAGLRDLTMVASSAPVPFEVKAGGDTGAPEPSPKKMPPANPSESEPSPPGLKPENSEQSNVAPSASKRVVAATVLGKPIYLDRIEPSAADLEWLRKSGRTPLSRKAERLLDRVAGKIMMDYYRREELHPTKAEISAKYSAAVRSDPELLAKMMLNKNARFEIGGSIMFGVASSVDWVITKHLYEKHGGSVSVSSFGGMMSIEGRNALLREYVARGDVQFKIPELEQALWEEVEKKRALDATVSDQKRVKQMFETPPWENYLAHRKKMEREQAATEQESMSERILTLCLLPFTEDPLWVICETEVSSLDDIEELGSDACIANTIIKTFPGGDKKAALKRGRELMKSRKLRLYLLTIAPKGGPGTLEEIGAPDVKNNDD